MVLPVSIESSWGILYSTEEESDDVTVIPVKVFFFPIILRL